MVLVAGPPRVDAVSVVNHLIAAKAPLGAVAELSAKAAAGKAAEVKLAACESAEVGFVDAKKKKGVKQKVWLELLVKPAAEGKSAAETALLASQVTPSGERSRRLGPTPRAAPPSPADPRPTYCLKVLTGTEGLENETVFEKDFTVETGKKTKLELVAEAEK